MKFSTIYLYTFLNSLCSASNKIKSRYDHSVLILFLLHLSTSLLAPQNKMCHQIFRMLPECSSTLAMIESTILRLETWICMAMNIEEQEECHISWILKQCSVCLLLFTIILQSSTNISGSKKVTQVDHSWAEVNNTLDKGFAQSSIIIQLCTKLCKEVTTMWLGGGEDGVATWYNPS